MEKDIITDILDEICYQEDRARQLGEWLQTKIGELTKEEMNLKYRHYQTNRLRDSYADNPRKTLDNFIFNKAQPQCNIEGNIIHS